MSLARVSTVQYPSNWGFHGGHPNDSKKECYEFFRRGN